MRKEIIRATALSFDPDVLLVDHMPHGAMGELLPTLDALSSSPVRMVLGLRDILDAPDTIRRRWHLEGAFEAVERYFDDVLVYGSRDVFDLATSYDWPYQLIERLHYCGYVCSPAPVPSSVAIRRRCLQHLPNGQLVVAMAGGGADAYPLFDTLLRAVPAVGSRCVVLLVTGPFLPDAERTRLQQLAEGLPVHIVRTVSDSLEYTAAADLVVAMAGYNTTAEILKVGAPALLVPRPGPSAEQTMRASRLAARGWVHWLPPDELSVERLAGAITAALGEPVGTSPAEPDLMGLQRAARHLLDATTAEFPTGRAVMVGGAAPARALAPALDEG
ncbi:MAG: glycosyltransferase family protein [Carbonactinosporaceae bacterium]